MERKPGLKNASYYGCAASSEIYAESFSSPPFLFWNSGIALKKDVGISFILAPYYTNYRHKIPSPSCPLPTPYKCLISISCFIGDNSIKCFRSHSWILVRGYALNFQILKLGGSDILVTSRWLAQPQTWFLSADNSLFYENLYGENQLKSLCV